jgi:hypothetical protein
MNAKMNWYPHNSYLHGNALDLGRHLHELPLVTGALISEEGDDRAVNKSLRKWVNPANKNNVRWSVLAWFSCYYRLNLKNRRTGKENEQKD